jgi:hypothetical protein
MDLSTIYILSLSLKVNESSFAVGGYNLTSPGSSTLTLLLLVISVVILLLEFCVQTRSRTTRYSTMTYFFDVQHPFVVVASHQTVGSRLGSSPILTLHYLSFSPGRIARFPTIYFEPL